MKHAKDRLAATLLLVPKAKMDPDRVKEMARIASEEAGSEVVMDALIAEIRDTWTELPSIATLRAALTAIKSRYTRKRVDCPACGGYVWRQISALVTHGPNGRATASLLTEEQRQRLEKLALPASQQIIGSTYPCWECEPGQAIITADEQAAKAAERVRQWMARMEQPAREDWAA